MINLSATLNGESVTILDVDVNGHSCYIVYKDISDNLKVNRGYFNNSTSASNIIATNVIIN